jgi:hypothetical protein
MDSNECAETNPTTGFFAAGGPAYSSADETWTTPSAFFARLALEFGGFAVDLACLTQSAKAPAFFAPDHADTDRQDTLSWSPGELAEDVVVAAVAQGRTEAVAWCNPPYGRSLREWMAQCRAVADEGVTVVCLVPARTDTRWWHESCMRGEVRLVKGRLKFGDGCAPAPFPSAVIVMRPDDAALSVVPITA